MEVPVDLMLPNGALLYTRPPYCVYFLILRGVVVYVGQTGNLPLRLQQHRNGTKSQAPKEFDQSFYLPTPPEQASQVERHWIGKLRPHHNSNGERCEHHTLFVQIPDIVWEHLAAESAAANASVTQTLTRVLATEYGIDPATLPRPKKAGRKPRPRP